MLVSTDLTSLKPLTLIFKITFIKLQILVWFNLQGLNMTSMFTLFLLPVSVSDLLSRHGSISKMYWVMETTWSPLACSDLCHSLLMWTDAAAPKGQLALAQTMKAKQRLTQVSKIKLVLLFLLTHLRCLFSCNTVWPFVGCQTASYQVRTGCSLGTNSLNMTTT